ncbi:MAG: hypothetical protein A7316_02290 [Candidatus Altiarchaeales archaeon WOR_SM1_86-2]|nr:MAG: hypothetical protein A7316_02290 [Candidatus Altiarchaeales archaeon WOR_SM1_86-2]
MLREDVGGIKSEVNELISMQEKRKLLSLFVDEIMKGAGQLSEDELVKLGRQFKKGRFEKLKQMGVV